MGGEDEGMIFGVHPASHPLMMVEEQRRNDCRIRLFKRKRLTGSSDIIGSTSGGTADTHVGSESRRQACAGGDEE